jgi:predicted metal-dependent hydrolase
VSDAVVQYVVSPLVLAILAGIGWIIRSYLKAIRHQVENDHGTNLRADVDRIILAVEKHDKNDKALSEAVRSLTTQSAKTAASVEELIHGHRRLEERFDRHIDKG